MTGRVAAWRRPVAALVLLTIVAAACGIPLDSRPRTFSVGKAGRPSAQGTGTSNGNTTAYLYFIKNDHLVDVQRDVTTENAEAVVRELATGPTATETANGLISQIPTGTMVRSVRAQSNGVTQVSLSNQFQNVIGTALLEAAAQILFTVTEINPGSKVDFVVGGQIVKVTSPTRGDVQRVSECDFVSLLPTDDQLRDADLTTEAARHLTARRRSLAARCPSSTGS